MEGREQGMNREMDKDRVLLVEDDGSLIDGLEYALKKDGFEVEVARSVEEFGKLYTDGRFDVVLLDVSLPDGNGFEICERIRRTSEVPILFHAPSLNISTVVSGIFIFLSGFSFCRHFYKHIFQIGRASCRERV